MGGEQGTVGKTAYVGGRGFPVRETLNAVFRHLCRMFLFKPSVGILGNHPSVGLRQVADFEIFSVNLLALNSEMTTYFMDSVKIYRGSIVLVRLCVMRHAQLGGYVSATWVQQAEACHE